MQETFLSKDDVKITKIQIKDEVPSTRYGFSPMGDGLAFFNLCSAVRQCGEVARNNQSLIHRALKSDGSILTETDLAVSDALLAKIKELYPDCNIVTEEIDLHSFKDGARYTFVLDPIDGTDAYSQGLPSWCIALGILDSQRQPCGAIIHAPRFGVGVEDLFLCAMPGDTKLYLNGKEHKTPQHYDIPRQMVMGSDALKYIDISSFSGKIRSFGSSILHMVAPVAFSNLDCTVDPYCYVWDIAASHAICLRAGIAVSYIDGSPVVYNDSLLKERNKIPLPLFIAHQECLQWMLSNMPLLK